MDNTQINPIIEAKNVSVLYGRTKAVDNVSLAMRGKAVYALIGPSGCGKSSLLRSFNRMNDFVENCSVEGNIFYKGQDIYDNKVIAESLRQKIGIVFQKPTPFPCSIYKNISWAPKLAGYKGDLDGLVEESLQKTGLWDEVKDRLKDSGLSLSGGQQQRLCIARSIAMNPDIILMDEPCSALDPVATSKIEKLIATLKEQYTIIIVTHSMAQAKRVSDYTSFLYNGKMIDFGLSSDIFNNPSHSLTKEYIAGSIG